MQTIDIPALDRRARYQLLTSLVVPRPIAWISTRSTSGTPNLAPFSYYTAVSATPMLVAVSVGHRRGEPKDTLRNVRETGSFCINLVTARHVEAMNETAAEVEPEADEFARAGLTFAEAESVTAPYVVDAPAVFECRLFKEVSLEGSSNTLLVGEVLRLRLAAEAHFVDGTQNVDVVALDPIARLWGDLYARLGEIIELPRPR